MKTNKNAKILLLEEWKAYEDLAAMLRNAYFAMKYGDSEHAISCIKNAELSGLPEKLAETLIQKIRKEQKNENP